MTTTTTASINLSTSSDKNELNLLSKSLPPSALNSSVLSPSKQKAIASFNSSTAFNSNLTSNEYSLTDIYEDAAVIGSELEKIISNYGSEVLKDLMPKVINVLELLENLTIKNERENEELTELRMRCQCLEAEKAQRLNEREKFEKELEEIEEKWKQETLKLISMVNKLKEDNKRLNDSLNESDFLNTSKQNEQFVIKQEELDYIRQIKEENMKLKESLRFKEKEIEQKQTDNEALQSQVDSLSSTMLNFRRKQILGQNQIEKLLKTKTDLECQLTEKQQELSELKQQMHINNISSEEQREHQMKINEQQSELEKERSNSRASSKSVEITIDPKDPNRPRFTLKELEKVLMEKNELTIKLDQTQEELDQLKKQEVYGEVQGPINKEPDDKLNPSQTSSSSGIRRLYVTENLLIVVVTSSTSRKLNVPFCDHKQDLNNTYSTSTKNYYKWESKEDETNECFLNEKHVEEEEDELKRQHEQEKYEKRYSFHDFNNNHLNELSSDAYSICFIPTHSSTSSSIRHHSFNLYLFLLILNVMYILFALKLSQILHILVVLLIDLFSCSFVYYFSCFVYLMYSISNWVLTPEANVSSANELNFSKNDENLATKESSEKSFNENEETDHFFFVYSFQQTFKLIKRKDNIQTA